MLQEFVVLQQDGVVRVPPHLSDAEAAALPTSAVAAWQALVTQGSVKDGNWVLVQGTGAVSLFALQAARLFGARVIATSSSHERRARVKALGATETLSRTEPGWVEHVREITGGVGVDHVVDVSGDLRAAIACLRVGGLISQIGYLSSTRLEADVFALLLSNARIQGISVGPRATFEDMNATLSRHEARPVVGDRFAFGDAARALSFVANESSFGKTVVMF
jgi:NADPH:quinone reductase-like Zn-dependent oxidoreductase